MKRECVLACTLSVAAMIGSLFALYADSAEILALLLSFAFTLSVVACVRVVQANDL